MSTYKSDDDLHKEWAVARANYEEAVEAKRRADSAAASARVAVDNCKAAEVNAWSALATRRDEAISRANGHRPQ